MRRSKKSRTAAAAGRGAPEVQFEQELEVFRTEVETALQFFYGFLAIHACAGDTPTVHRLLNTAPLFWNSTLGGGFNWSRQHIPRTCLLGFDRARSFWAFH